MLSRQQNLINTETVYRRQVQRTLYSQLSENEHQSRRYQCTDHERSATRLTCVSWRTKYIHQQI